MSNEVAICLTKEGTMKKFISVLMICIMVLSLSACTSKSSKVGENALGNDWNSILQSAKGTTVNFYGWGGDERTNKWIDTFLAQNLKEKYDINLKRVPMNIEDILNKLLGEKQVNAQNGTIDVVWINGENFFTAKKNNLLFGPFTDKLPSFQKYVDKESIEVNSDFGFPVEGYEAPYGKAQFVMIYDKDRLNQVPKNHMELLEMAKKNPGKFTYPAPPDFTGSAFVRNIIYDIVGYEKFVNMKADKAVVEKEIKPAIDFLKELKPYLWREGKTYPATIAQLDNMYADNEVIMSMNYNPYAIPGRVKDGQYPQNSDSFVFDKGTIGNTHFLAIPFNAPNRSGALAVIDYILSVEAQASKYNPENWGDLPVLDNNKLSEDEKKIFSDVKIGKGTLDQETLLRHRVPEMSADLVPIIEEIWMENILKGE
jgi:putative spermidine/putrescine transport system substrate-binding protein